jgi:hypothetical protein
MIHEQIDDIGSSRRPENLAGWSGWVQILPDRVFSYRVLLDRVLPDTA